MLFRSILPSRVLVPITLVAATLLCGGQARAGDARTYSGTVGTASYSATDSDGDGLPESFTITQPPEQMTVTVAPGGQITVLGVTICVGTTGNDTILEGYLTGPVLAFGGPGDDTLQGGMGPDILDGGDGDDTLHGGAGDDHLKGGPGDDVADGGPGDDIVGGGGDDDDLDGGDGDDMLLGGTGDDDLCGGAGIDYTDGGPGDDHFDGTEPGTDIVYGGSGADVVEGTDGEAGDDIDLGSDLAPDSADADPGDTVENAGPEDTVN